MLPIGRLVAPEPLVGPELDDATFRVPACAARSRAEEQGQSVEIGRVGVEQKMGRGRTGKSGPLGGTRGQGSEG